MMRRLRGTILPNLMIAGLLVFAFPVAGGERIVIDRAHIIVNDKMVTKREMELTRKLRERDYRTRLKGEELEARLRDLDELITTQIIETLLLEARAEQLGIQVSDEEIEERVSSILQRDPRISGLYTDQALKEFVVKDMLQKRVIQREVGSRVFVSDKAVEAACREEVRQGREIDVGHILVKGEQGGADGKLGEIQRRLKEGESFEAVAQELSEDPSAGRNKGRLGFIGKGQFVQKFEKAAFALAPGEVSPPVQTKFGHHIIKVFAERSKQKIDCKKIPERERRRIHAREYNRVRNAEMGKYLAKLKKKAEINVLD